MKREELLRSRDYWINEIQNDLYGVIKSYMEKKELNRTQLASELNVTKGYISQVLNGDFDHKISKMVDLALASGKVPMLYFVDLEQFIKDDLNNKSYDLISPINPNYITYSSGAPYQQPQEIKPFPHHDHVKTQSFNYSDSKFEKYN